MYQIIKINDTFLCQVVELQNRLSEESKKADKLDFEYKRLKEKVDSLQKEKDVILKCSIYVPVNTDVCREQDAITGCAKGIKYIIYNPSLKNFLRRVCKLSNKTQLRACQPYRTLGEQ